MPRQGGRPAQAVFIGSGGPRGPRRIKSSHFSPTIARDCEPGTPTGASFWVPVGGLVRDPGGPLSDLIGRLPVLQATHVFHPRGKPPSASDLISSLCRVDEYPVAAVATEGGMICFLVFDPTYLPCFQQL